MHPQLREFITDEIRYYNPHLHERDVHEAAYHFTQELQEKFDPPIPNNARVVRSPLDYYYPTMKIYHHTPSNLVGFYDEDGMPSVSVEYETTTTDIEQWHGGIDYYGETIRLRVFFAYVPLTNELYLMESQPYSYMKPVPYKEEPIEEIAVELDWREQPMKIKFLQRVLDWGLENRKAMGG